MKTKTCAIPNDIFVLSLKKHHRWNKLCTYEWNKLKPGAALGSEFWRLSIFFSVKGKSEIQGVICIVIFLKHFEKSFNELLFSV